jgi:glycosyltransferase involved in cell wall biosynthesis
VAPLFSVVVCTFNHAKLLSNALDSLCRQRLAPDQFEIIVVDNNSTDNTRAVATARAGGQPDIRYYLEPAQGLSHARNVGWRQAKGTYVAYIDDDCLAPEEWLTTAAEIAKRLSPAVMGGPYHGAFPGKRPAWVGEGFNSYIPFKEQRFLGPREYGSLVGGNVFFKRTVFDAIGPFDPQFGHVGNTLAYGDETDVLRRANEAFPGSLYYDPALFVHHVVRPEKLTLSYNIRSAFGAGRSMVRQRMGRAGPRPPLTRAAKAMTALTADVLVRILLRDRQKYPHPRNYLHERSLEYVTELGTIYEHLRQKRTPAAATK